MYIARGACNVSIAGHGDKRQAMALMMSNVAGEVLLVQVIFWGKTFCSLPKGQYAHRITHHG